MLFEHIISKVTVEIAIDSMDMIRIILRVRIFQEEMRALNAVVMAFALLRSTSPGKGYFVPASFF